MIAPAVISIFNPSAAAIPIKATPIVPATVQETTNTNCYYSTNQTTGSIKIIWT